MYDKIATVAKSQDQLPKTISSDMSGNPPLYITKNRNGDIYVNNARIIPSLSVEMTNSNGNRQVSERKLRESREVVLVNDDADIWNISFFFFVFFFYVSLYVFLGDACHR